MKGFNGALIVFALVLALFCISRSALAEGTWTQSGNNIYNTNTGNVGIGTTSPGNRLDIKGVGSTYYATEGLRISGGPYAAYTELVAVDAIEGTFSQYYQQFKIKMKRNNDASVLDAMDIRRSTDTIKVLFPNGNVGIGTTSPGSKLEVSDGWTDITGTYGVRSWGVGKPGDSNYEYIVMKHSGPGDASIEVYGAGTGIHRDLKFLTSNIERMRIAAGGNVGIGTTSPGNRLDIKGVGSTYYATEGLRISGGPYTAYTELVAVDAIEGTPSQYYQQFKIKMKRNNDASVLDAMDIRRSTDSIKVLFPNGNVGIGTTSPQSKFRTLDLW